MASEQNLLDAINRRILEELQHDGRIAFAELGRRVDLSAPAVAERCSCSAASCCAACRICTIAAAT